ncbi:unnamed protein product [Gongylonema pulchrum]|uniref:UBP-type domain-containing protein n=1 Tax=Gongylonema pulchrum TaxID=637853 RepID=A0A3P6PTL2_9BILA|nr:unnamed protein product [Gongylonema pulchrum]
MAIGVEGGFCSGPKYEIENEYAIVVHPHFKTKYSINSEGVQKMERIEAGVSAWDGEAKVDTKHLNLEQLDNGKKIAESGWQCEELGCDLTENLWLNLTDGAVKCGRSQYLQEGVMSAGRNHMRLHFEKYAFFLL